MSVHIFDIENIACSQIIPSIAKDTQVIYRGWMLSEALYSQLEQRFGKQLLTSKEAYYNAHYFPNWYEAVQSLTIPSIVTNEQRVFDEFKKFSGKAFLKDFVKSLKTGKGSIVDSQEDIARALSNMRHYRGTIEGGLVLREVVNLVPNSEIRYFVINNTIYEPLNEPSKRYIVEEAVKKLAPKNLKFYSVDVALTKEGKHVLIEIGDGQVSDYVGWLVNDFIAILKNYVHQARRYTT